MKISDKKFKNILAVAGISSAMILTGCSAGASTPKSNHNTNETYVVDGKERKKAYKDGKEGYYDHSGVFIPHTFVNSSSKSKSSSKSSSIRSGSGGLGSSSKGGASS